MKALTLPNGTAPIGFFTDSDPDASLRTYAGTPHTVPGRQVAAYASVILHRDGEIADDFVTVEVGEVEQQFTLQQARALARAVTAAADDLQACDPTHPLDSISTADITGPGALRAALAAADPEALTRDDRAALLDLLNRSFAAAGVE